MNWRRYFQVPEFDGDENKRWQAQKLLILLWPLLGISITYIGIALVIKGPVLDTVIASAFLVLLGWGLWGVQKGYTVQVSWGLLLFIWFNTWLQKLYTEYDLTASYLLLVTMAGVLLRGKIIFLFFGLSLLIEIVSPWLKFLDEQHMLVEPLGGDFIFLIFTMIVQTILIYVAQTGLENSLAKARAEAERAQVAERAKAQFLATMSHEIRTPLNTVVGLTGVLQETDLDGEQKELVNLIQNGGDVLLVLVNDILDFSKMEAGKVRLHEEPFDVESCIKVMMDLVSVQALSKSIQLSYEIEEEPLWIVGDMVRIRQVLTNLLMNGVKFTAKGSVSLRVTVDGQLGEKSWIQFEVTDTGIGIAKEKQALLFKTFSQLDSSMTRIFGGTGLGLAISKQLVELMGGMIWVESEVGKGSRFFFKIPALRVAPVVANKASETLIVDDLGSGSGNIGEQMPLTILIADDNRVSQKVTQKILHQWGYEGDVVHNGRDAVEKVQNKRYDLVLMDIQMPVMDGYAATRYIRKEVDRSAQPYIVALTANVSVTNQAAGMSAGMDGYLGKPFERKMLLAFLKKAYQRKQGRTVNHASY
ncbi:MAG TPA: ATP-binding protein [Anaerolineae bacterium]|nr:ATP-binding protein [Anaerolineae bacterium]